MNTYKIRQYVQELTALKDIYNNSGNHADETIKKEVARQQLLKTIHETRKAIASMERELHVE